MGIDIIEAKKRGLSMQQAEDFESRLLVRVRRPDGKETLLRVPGEHLQRVLDLANGEFGDKSILESNGR